MSSDIRAILFDGAVTPTLSDTTNEAGGPYAGLFVGSTSAGAVVKLTTSRGQDVTLNGLVAGTIYPISVKRIWSTGTTATNLLLLQAANDVR